ncbi:DsbA family protein [Pontimonas sp.]|nr:thioredoxin domain-containing protein [Pontimonas sp.]MDA8909509.1 DsbA family protein [Pontimonas sp.]
MNAPDNRPTKNEKRQDAREKARSMREAQIKRSKRNKVLTQASWAIGVLGVVTVVTLLIVTSLRPPGPGPANMQSDGIKIGAGLTAAQTPALLPDELPIPSEPNADGVPAISVFLDYTCPACAQFEGYYGPILRTWLENGTATVAYHPLSFRDSQTGGTRFATRAANAAACVADKAPDSFFDFTQLMFENQPQAPASYELTDAQMVEIAGASGVENIEAVASCIEEETFSNWVGQATARAMSSGPVPVKDSEVALIKGTPTVLVNGKEFQPEVHGDLANFVASLEESE